VCVCMRVCEEGKRGGCLRVCVCACACVCICVRVFVYMCAFACVFTCVFACVCMCVCVRVRVCAVTEQKSGCHFKGMFHVDSTCMRTHKS